MPAHKKPPTDTRRLPIAVATNQPPIIIPFNFGGATLLTNEIPIGERSNSANVRIRYVRINQYADVNVKGFVYLIHF